MVEKKSSGNYRKYTTTSGKIVIGGKDAEQNEEVVNQASSNEYIVHTVAAGSPFCNIKADAKKVSEQDLHETCVFCSKYSRDWKKNKKNVRVNIFIKKDVYKKGDMKTGTFGVKKSKEIIVKKEDIEKFS